MDVGENTLSDGDRPVRPDGEKLQTKHTIKYGLACARQVVHHAGGLSRQSTSKVHQRKALDTVGAKQVLELLDLHVARTRQRRVGLEHGVLGEVKRGGQLAQDGVHGGVVGNALTAISGAVHDLGILEKRKQGLSGDDGALGVNHQFKARPDSNALII